MTATERAKRSDALYYETVSVNRRVLCDMVANRESDLEDAKAENEHMRIKAIAVVGELQEENERLKAENAKLRELVKDMWPHVRHRSRMCGECELPCDTSDECLLYEPMRQRMRDLGVEVKQ